jgi:hypothetical protein
MQLHESSCVELIRATTPDCYAQQVRDECQGGCNHCTDTGFQYVFKGGQAAAYIVRVEPFAVHYGVGQSLRSSCQAGAQIVARANCGHEPMFQLAVFEVRPGGHPSGHLSIAVTATFDLPRSLIWRNGLVPEGLVNNKELGARPGIRPMRLSVVANLVAHARR